MIDVGKWSKLELNTHRKIRRLKMRDGKEGVSDMGSSMGTSFFPLPDFILIELASIVTDESDEDSEETESTSEEEQSSNPQLPEVSIFLRQLYRAFCSGVC